MTQFFYPREGFLEQLAGYIGDRPVIEAGAGECNLTMAMHRHGIKAMAVEPYPSERARQVCFSFLLPTRIEDVAILKDFKGVVIVARPDHGGWVNKLPGLLHPDAELLYIGLPDNFEVDGVADSGILLVDVGTDGEAILKVSP